MGWIWREKSDGTRGLAYPVYVAGGLAALALIEVVHRRLSPAAAASALPITRSRVRGADVSAITGAAAGVVPVTPPRRPRELATESDRLPSGRRGASRSGAAGGDAAFALTGLDEATPAGAARSANPGVANFAGSRGRSADGGGAQPDSADFDAIRATLHPDADDGSAGSGRQARYAALPPAFAGEGANLKPQLMGYRDPAEDPGSTATPPAAPPPAPWLARGSLLPVYLLTTVDTSNPAAVIQFAVARDVWAHGRCRLRFATRLLGKVAGRVVRDRLTLAVDTVLYPDGLQRPISATTVEADERGSDIRPGLAAGYVPPPAWVTATPYVSDFATGFLGLLQSRAQQTMALNVGGVGVQTSVPDDARGPAYQASGQAVNDFTRDRLRELQDRYAGYYLIPAGTAAWLQLESDFAPPNDPHEP